MCVLEMSTDVIFYFEIVKRYILPQGSRLIVLELITVVGIFLTNAFLMQSYDVLTLYDTTVWQDAIPVVPSQGRSLIEWPSLCVFPILFTPKVNAHVITVNEFITNKLHLSVNTETYLHVSDIIYGHVQGGRNIYEETYTALAYNFVNCKWYSTMSLQHSFICVQRKEAWSQSIHTFILHLKTTTCFGYTYVAVIRLNIEPSIRRR
jgi:hypothetical protein